MARGFKAVNRTCETLTMRDMKQTDYEYLERLYSYDNSRTARAKLWMRRPAYCIGERRKAWEQTQTNGRCMNI